MYDCAGELAWRTRPVFFHTPFIWFGQLRGPYTATLNAADVAVLPFGFRCYDGQENEKSVL